MRRILLTVAGSWLPPPTGVRMRDYPITLDKLIKQMPQMT
jgi:hypothetical protein